MKASTKQILIALTILLSFQISSAKKLIIELPEDYILQNQQIIEENAWDNQNTIYSIKNLTLESLGDYLNSPLLQSIETIALGEVGPFNITAHPFKKGAIWKEVDQNSRYNIQISNNVITIFYTNTW